MKTKTAKKSSKKKVDNKRVVRPAPKRPVHLSAILLPAGLAVLAVVFTLSLVWSPALIALA